MTTKHTDHPLTTHFWSAGWGYTVEENLPAYLALLRKGKLYETLKKGYPGKEIILNLTDAYAEMTGVIFWDEDGDYDEALDAFPLLVNYILETELGIYDLYHVSEIVENFLDDGLESGPEHLQELKENILLLSAIFEDEKYKSAIYAGLKDKSRNDYDELISMASAFYGESTFELFFSFAKHQPIQVLELSYWTSRMDEGQYQRFMEWTRSYMPADRLEKPVSRNYEYNKTEKAILERVFFYPEETLKTRRDRYDFLIWGISSTDEFMASKAAWLLEDLPLSEWPQGSMEIIEELFNVMEPNWITNVKKENRSLTIKERLGRLLKKDT